MFKNLVRIGLLSTAALTAFTSCENQEFTNENVDAKRVEVQQLSAELAKVRDYVPLYAVVAHRGSTFWVPEETESAWRWAREMGVDYLESDLQCTKDGVVLANHDENLKRTTNIENVFSEYVPQTRVAFTNHSVFLTQMLLNNTILTLQTSDHSTHYLTIMKNF